MKRKPFSLFLCILAISMFLSYHIYYYTLEIINNKKVDNFIQEEKTNQESTILVEKEIDEKDKNKKNNIDIYGVLEIPKIKLKQAIFEINSKNNTVEKHLELLENEDNLMVLAAHSGNSYLGYFKNLDQLSINDEVSLFYQNKKNNYIVSDIYELDKNGKIMVNQNINEKLLVLTTCSKKKDKQLVVVTKYLKNKL